MKGVCVVHIQEAENAPWLRCVAITEGPGENNVLGGLTLDELQPRLIKYVWDYELDPAHGSFIVPDE